MINALNIISTFSQTILVTRYSAGAFVSGTFVPGTTSVIPVRGSVQPMTGKEMVRDVSGNRTTAKYKIYSTTTLYPSREGGVIQADEVMINGDTYQVDTVQTWPDFNMATLVLKSGS